MKTKQKLKVTIEAVIDDLENYSVNEILQDLNQYCKAELVKLEVIEPKVKSTNK